MSNIDTLRQEVYAIGKEYYIMQEMLRTGFLKMPQADLDRMKIKLTELGKVNQELNKVSKELKDIPDITPIIKEIRKNRIERVRAQRAINKVEKAQKALERKAEISEKRKSTPTYLGDIAKGLKFDNADIEKLKAHNLLIINDLKDLSEASGFTREELLWLCYHRQTATIDHYTRFQIPKRKGGMRSIASPKGKMRQAQTWVLENILNKIPIHEAAVAFQSGKSIVDNAQVHLQKNILVRIDLKDFFPSIKFLRVKGLFQSFGYNSGISTVFALMCTDAARIGAKFGDQQYFVALSERYLPQGACTSPAITNIICRKLDNRLSKLAEKMGFTYTRYADDMTFSHADKNAELKALLGLTKKIIAEENFEINEEKTLIMRSHTRQTVTGIVVNNDEMRISRRDIRRFRAFLHQYTLKGAEAMTQKLGKDATQYAKGYLAFVQMVNPAQAEKFKKEYIWLG
jgi:RNA-directed DNA polymerase